VAKSETTSPSGGRAIRTCRMFAVWSIGLWTVCGLATPAATYTWITETADSSAYIVDYTSLALSACGDPHIAYHNSTRDSLVYVCCDSSGWRSHVLDACLVGYVSLALDGSGYPHITYKDFYLRYARQGPTGWQFGFVPEDPYGGNYCSLALDSLGYAHVCYRYELSPWDGFLRYAYEDASGWHFLDPGSEAGPSSLVLDAGKYPHIAVSNWCTHELLYFHQDSLGWHGESVTTGDQPCLKLGADGSPHLAFSGLNWALMYAHRDSSGWHLETVDQTGTTTCWPSLALSDLDCPHISYYDAVNDDLRLATKCGSVWHVEVVESKDDVGWFTSVAFDQFHRPRISYFDAWNDHLKYARARGPMMTLCGTAQGGQLVLTWTAAPEASSYWVYGACNQTYFNPGFSPGYQHRLAVLSPLFLTWSSQAGIAHPDSNWTYMVLAIDGVEQEMCRSNRSGEHDFDLTSP
jgi:hypothetical protein